MKYIKLGLVAAFILTLILAFTITAYANIDDNAGGDSNVGGGGGGSWNDSKTGWRITIIDVNDGTPKVVAGPKDFVFSDRAGNGSGTWKFGSEVSGGFKRVDDTGMPKPVVAVSNGAGGWTFKGQGEMLREWFMTIIDTSTNTSNLGGFINKNFDGIWDECIANNYKIVVECLYWFEPIRSDGSRVGYVVYDTASNFARFHNEMGFGPYAGNMSLLASDAGPNGTILLEDDDNAELVSRGAKQPNPTSGFISNTTILSGGWGVQIYTPSPGGATVNSYDTTNKPTTETFSQPLQNPKQTPNKRPKSPDNLMMIIKTYVDITDPTDEKHITTVNTGGYQNEITAVIMDEPDVFSV